MFERFTEKAIKVILLAQEESRRLGYNFVGTEHVLLGLLGEGTGLGARALQAKNLTLQEARVEVEKITGRGSEVASVEIPFTPRCKRLLESAWGEARQLGHNYIGTEHLLLGLISEGEGVGARSLENKGIDLAELRETVFELWRQCAPKEDEKTQGMAVSDLGPESDDEYPYHALREDPIDLRTKLMVTVNALSCSAIFEKVSDNAVRAIFVAHEELHRTFHGFVGSEQLLVGLFEVEDGKASLVLREKGIQRGRLRTEIKKIIGVGQRQNIGIYDLPYTPRLKRALTLARLQAEELEHDYIGTAHLLLGMLKEHEGVGVQVLENLDVDLGELRRRLISILTSNPEA